MKMWGKGYLTNQQCTSSVAVLEAAGDPFPIYSSGFIKERENLAETLGSYVQLNTFPAEGLYWPLCL